jgi:dihydrofolate synthase/folylpolyglutamate synthase
VRPARDDRGLRVALRSLEVLAPPERMDLGLDRMRAAARRLGLLPFGVPALVVGGTNGKGSVAAMLAALLRAGGRRVGLYTSPHLHAYRERIAIDGRPLSSRLLLELLGEVRARAGDLSLTYFEITTLVALAAFLRRAVDVAVLEVGLGGRLDAVNVIDGEAATVVSVDLDHTEWLGPDREAIGREKAGIFRPGRPALVGDEDPPASLLRAAADLGADLWRRGRDFVPEAGGRPGTWTYRGRALRFEDLPPPAVAGSFQVANAALALAVLESRKDLFPLERSAVEAGLRAVRLAGRLETVEFAGRRVVFDVAHNPAAARTLAAELARESPPSRSVLVLGMLADKDPVGFVGPLLPHTTDLVLLSLPPPRGLEARALAERLEGSGLPPPVVLARRGGEAFTHALARTEAGDRLLVTGSFRTVAALREAYARRALASVRGGRRA